MSGPAFSLLDSAAPLLKRYYDDRRVYSMTYKNRPLYAWLPKKTGVVGEDGGYRLPVTIDDIPGESASFPDAVDARDGDSHEVWALKRITRYGTATLDWQTVRAMKNDVGAFMRAVTPRIDSAINQLANSAAAQCYMDGSGARGITTAVTSGADGTVTLTTPLEARRFGLRRTCVLVDAVTDITAGPIGGASNTAKIKGIDQKNGIITFDNVPADWGTTNAGVGNALFLVGDTWDGSTVSPNQDGLDAWLPDPTTVNPGDLFKGVERAKYKEKLLGLHYDATAGDIDANIRQAAAELQANEGSPDALFLNPTRWAELETKLASQSRYEMMMGSDARTGFDSIVINAGGGKINVVADPWCPPERGYMLQRDTWTFFSIDRYPDFVSEDGNRLHRLERADEVEFRVGGYHNLACTAPGHNLVLNFA